MFVEIFKQLNALFKSSNFDLVIHFAAVAYVGESSTNPLLYYKNITANTGNVLEAMSRGGVSKIVYSSTCATYGNAEKMPITESTPQIPVNPYGRSKLLCEEMIKEYAAVNPSFDAVILRYFNVIGADPTGIVGEVPVGPMAKKFGRISSACFDVALGLRETLSIMGTDHNTPDGTCVRDYIHVVDLVDAHVKAFTIMKGEGSVNIYNVAVGKGYSVREFIDACKNVTGKDITIVEAPSRDGDAAFVFADPTKIKNELGWQPQYMDLRESLRTSWHWTARHGGSYPRQIADPHLGDQRYA
jgi:UDP-arabinose 4-epimerase